MIDILVPFEQEGTKAVVRSWLAKLGDRVAIDDPLVELETDKVTQEVSSPGAGILAEILIDSDGEAVPGTILGRISTGAEATDAQSPVEERTEPPSALAESRAPVAKLPQEAGLSPSVRRGLAQHGIDPADVTGTGRRGRITRADVDAHAARMQNGGGPAAARPVPAPAAPAPASGQIPHDRMRLAIAENMSRALAEAPHVTAVFECDFSAVLAHLKAHKPALAARGVALTLTAYIVRAAALAMEASPTVNSRWHDAHLDLFSDINIGVGTALGDKGLVVPVVPKVQSLSLEGIAEKLTDLVARARTNQLTPADMRGGTFTISNHGVSGSLVAAPVIIHQGQAAILGVGKLEKRVVVREVDGVDTIQIRPMAYVSLSIDHRVLDGHQTNSWLTKFVEAIEQWK